MLAATVVVRPGAFRTGSATLYVPARLKERAAFMPVWKVPSLKSQVYESMPTSSLDLVASKVQARVERTQSATVTVSLTALVGPCRSRTVSVTT